MVDIGIVALDIGIDVAISVAVDIGIEVVVDIGMVPQLEDQH